MDIIFKGRHTDVLERFRRHATAKLTKIERLSAKALRVDVEVSAERNPRQSGRKERVELTITSSGPAIRAEAAAEDRFAALDMALAKLESRLRRANDRRKGRHSAHSAAGATALASGAANAAAVPGAGVPVLGARVPAPGAGVPAPGARVPAPGARVPAPVRPGDGAQDGQASDIPSDEDGRLDQDIVQIEMDGDGPLVVREKFHGANPMAIDQALLEMELVGHDFFLFRDAACGVPSVVYRRRGYQYGVIRLVEDGGHGSAGRPGSAARPEPNGQVLRQPESRARLGAG